MEEDESNEDSHSLIICWCVSKICAHRDCGECHLGFKSAFATQMMLPHAKSVEAVPAA
jgi:hypothetical protein